MKTFIQAITITLIFTLNIFQISQLQAQCHIDDWTALKALYESTDGNNWTDNTGWEQVTGTTPPAGCDFGGMYGVSIDGNGRVSELDLSSNQLSGTIPSELGNLSNLTYLRLDENQLTGSIPLELGNLTNLTELNLYTNQLSGNIPSALGDLTNLTAIRLGSNYLNGSIPTELGNLSNLTELYLFSNELTGSIPSEIGNLTNLTHLNLSGNQLSSNIPVELENLSNLAGLYLANNQLSGIIPPQLGNLSNLTKLWLYTNQLTGNIPSELGDLDKLIELNLSRNQLIGNIPSELSNLSSLTSLTLSYNELSGSIPVELGDLTELHTMQMQGNDLTGNIPSEIGNLVNLRYLNLASNRLDGSIPAELGQLINLINLSLYWNELSGSIPKEFSNLINLTRLSLYYNNLSGCFDIDLAALCNQLVSGHFDTSGEITNGNNFDASWEDFCTTGAGACNDNVFPGDCNTDGIVNTEDALYWGLAEGFNGAPRPNATTDCSLQTCNDWSQSVDGINSKHQDSNGNGTIDGQDLQIVISNYGCVNDYTAPAYASGTPIYRVQPQGINGDDKYQYDVYVENGSGAAAIAHGLAFTITSDVIPIAAITMSATGSSLNPDIEFAILDGNQCHAAITRTDNYDVTCAGPIATLLVETDDVPLDIPFEINVTSGAKIKADATLDNITGATAFGMYSGAGASSSNLLLDASVTHEQCNGLGGAIAIPSGGTSPYTYAWSTGANTVQVNNLASDTYTVTVTDANGLNQSLSLRINGQTPIYDANGNLLCGNLCPEYLAPSGVTGSGLYNASNALNSDATIPAGNIAEYKAGQVIQLKSGFKVQPNAEFSAEIEDCQ